MNLTPHSAIKMKITCVICVMPNGKVPNVRDATVMVIVGTHDCQKTIARVIHYSLKFGRRIRSERRLSDDTKIK